MSDAIAFTTGTYRSRVDGTLVLSIEIEPRHAQDALKLFSMPGTPGAIARLQTTTAPEPQPERASGLWLDAVRICQNDDFRNYAMARDFYDARGFVLDRCGIESRRELNTNPHAAAKFRQMMANFNAEK